VCFRRAISEEDSDLTVLNSTGRPRILLPHASGFGPLFQEARFINDQHAILLGQMLDDGLLQVIAHVIGSSFNAPQKVLNVSGRRIARMFG